MSATQNPFNEYAVRSTHMREGNPHAWGHSGFAAKYTVLPLPISA